MIEALANETAGDPAQVERIYVEEVERLTRTSRIAAFVPLLAARRVRDRLRSRAMAAGPARPRPIESH